MSKPAAAAAVRRHAVIDIGSIAVRLQIGRWEEGKVLTEVFTRIPLGLGGSAYRHRGSSDGGQRGQRISAASQRRLVETLAGMMRLVAAMKPCRTTVIATAAIRDAANRAEVLQTVKRECGIAIRVLSGSEEAAETGAHAAGHFPRAAAVLNADIGGGSTDCALVQKGALVAAETFALGTARRGGGGAQEKTRCHEWLRAHTPARVVVTASGGSAMQMKHCCGELSERAFTRWQRQTKGMSVAALAAAYQMEPDRAAHVVTAVEFYRLLIKATACKVIQPVRAGLAEAVIKRKLAR